MSDTIATDAPKRKGFPPIADRVVPELTAIRTDIAIPEVVTRAAKRGAKSVYPFDELPIGGSFGIKNKTLKQVNSVVSSVNRKHLTPKLDASGNIVTRPVTARTRDGVTVTTPGTKPVMVATKRFIAAEVNPKTDPEKASVRVWRVELPE